MDHCKKCGALILCPDCLAVDSDKDALREQALALLDLDARNALAPHGIGGLARQIIERLLSERALALASQSQERAAEIRRAAIEECAKPIKEKIEQLIAYLPSCEGDSEIKRHARAFADGRFAQAQMDLDHIRALLTDGEVKT